MHTVSARKTVVDSVEECIESIRHVIQDDPKACRKIDEEITDSASGFWSKFNVNVNGNDAPTPSSGNRRSLRQSVAAASSSSSSSAVSVGHNSESKKKEELEKAVNQLQNRLTKIREEKLLEDLKLKAADKAEAVLLANCGWEGARLMHHIKPMEKALTLTDFQFRSAMRHKYGLPPMSASDRVWNCVCGKNVGAGHNHACNRVMGPATMQRHESVGQTIAQVLREELKLVVINIPRTYVKDGEDEKYLIPDLIIRDSTNTFRTAVDVSGVYGEAKTNVLNGSVANKSVNQLRSTAAVEKRENRKEVHYRVLEWVADTKVVPFVFESHGGLGKRAEEFIDLIAQYGSDEVDGIQFAEFKGYLKRRVAIAIQRGNALLDQRAASAQARAMGAKIARGIVAAAA